MPLKGSVSNRIKELYADNRKKGKARGASGKTRSRKQIIAIAISSSKPTKTAKKPTKKRKKWYIEFMPNALDNFIESFGGYDKLNAAERETYRQHLKVIEGKPITIEATKEFVRRMITAIEQSLVDTKENSHDSRNLKARLKNFLVLEAFLFSPERARKSLETYYNKMGK